MDAGNIEMTCRLLPAQEEALALAAASSGTQGQGHFECTLEGPLEIPVLERAWQALVNRHPVLRTAFVWRRTVAPLQVVLRRVEARLEDPATNGFELSRAPAARLSVWRSGDTKHRLRIQFHRILLDRTSARRLVSELLTAYDAVVNGVAWAGNEASPTLLAYVDSVRRQDRQAAERFWRSALQGKRWETDSLRTIPNGGPMRRALRSAAACSAIAALSSEYGIAAETVAAIAWAIIFARCLESDELTFAALRHCAPLDLGDHPGPFTNASPAWLRLQPGGSVLGAMRQLEQHWREARLFDWCSSAQIREWCGAEDQALFQTAVEVILDAKPTGAPGPFAITDGEMMGGLACSVVARVYLRDNLLEVESAAGVDVPEPRCWEAVIEQIAANPRLAIGEISLAGLAERQRVVFDWNQTASGLLCGQPVPALLEQQALSTPDSIAVSSGDEHLSYAELNRRADRLALRLAAAGVGPDVSAGVLVSPSLEMIVAVWGVWKSGGAFVPLDERLPGERLRWMLQDCGARLVITTLDLAERLPEMMPHLLAGGDREAARDNQAAAIGAPDCRNLAYIIYTSGSTGVPKGVLVEHRGLENLARTQIETFDVKRGSRVLQFASLGFDASVSEILMAHLAGATLCLALRERSFPGGGLEEMLEDEAISHVTFPPSVLAVLDRAPGTLRHLVTAGEACWQELAEKWSAGRRLFNAYGPTEATVCASTAEYAGGSPSIGRPMRNVRLYVLDACGQPLPADIEGELYIAGEGVARGYVGRPELTAERFVPDALSGEAGARLYRTGDRARWSSDGTLEYLGRTDRQVKVRGYRIEPGEVEAVLRQQKGVREALVVARGGGLVAYVVGDKPNPPRLAATLPDYMVPATIVALPRLPLTANGKVDHKALPEPASCGIRESQGPRGPVEDAVAQVWREVLGRGEEGRHDNFFESGGHSLLATQAVSRLRRLFGVELPLRVLFERPTIAGLAEWIECELRGGRRSEMPRLERGDHRDARLSYAQQRLWFVEQLGPATAAYNIPLAVELSGDLDVAALERSLAAIVERHEILRTRFESLEGGPRQVIEAGGGHRFGRVELGGIEGERQQAEIRRVARREGGQAIPLSGGAPWRGAIVRLAQHRHLVLWTLHHIIADGWSMGVLVRELGQLYASRGLDPLPVQYADFAEWQRGWLRGERLDAELDYWRGQLAEAAVLELPADHRRRSGVGQRGGAQAIGLERELVEGLRGLGRQEGTTLFMTLLAAFVVVLWRYTGQDDIVVGTDIAGRNHAGIEGLVGFFVNQLVLRTAVRGGSSFRELLGRVREVALEGYAHQDVPFEKVVEALQPERDLTRHPLFQVKLVLQNAPVGELEMEGVRLRGVESGTLWAKYDVLLMLGEQGGEVRGRLEYNAELYESWRMERMAEHLRRVLEQAVREPDRRLREVAVLSDGERREVVEEWNRTEEVWGGAQTVTECLEESAAKWPESIAVAYGEEQLSYGELNRRANQLGRYLREWGVGPEVRVGLVVERSVEEAIAIWGVLKAGGAYVPLEASYPEERLGWLLEDSQVAVVVASRGAELPSFAGVVVSLDEIGGYGGDNLAVEVGARNLAYVIYTSGSTGRPKGVLVEHAGVVNYLRWAASAYAGGESTGSVVHSPLTFDLTVTSMFVPWMRGSEVRLVGRDPSLTQLREWSEAGRYSLLKITPAHLRVLGESVAGVEHLVVGGEALEGASLEPWRREAPETWVVNEYGPTETVVGCSVYTGRAKEYGAEAAPIGRGIANTQMYVLDGAMEAVPVGVRGEIYIGGAGVARGYLGRPELTAERFVPDGLSGEVGGRLYRTGDLGSWRRDGNLEFLGRADRQVKVRGYRVEPGEVEAVLRQQSGVREALVVAREGGLIAYVVGEGLESPVLRQAMRAALPDYMVPGVVIELARLPLTANGKFDAAALPAVTATPEVRSEESAYTPEQELMAGIWAEVLGRVQVGREDDFFELGGHSLLATQVISRVRSILGVELPLRALFESPTVAGLTAEVEHARRRELPPLEGRERRERRDARLSYAQQRLWFVEQLGPATAAYNIPLAVELSGDLDVAALERSLAAIVERHEILRTRFESLEGGPRQVIEAGGGHRFGRVELGGIEGERQQAEIRRVARREGGQAIPLSGGAPWRGAIVRLAQHRHLVLWTLHHIIADGWSMGVLVRELGQLYASRGLDPLPVQYADFAEWQRGWLRGERLDAELDYWRGQLAEAAVLELPADHRRRSGVGQRGGAQAIGLERELVEGLRGLGRQEGTTLFMTLLAAFVVVLWRYTGQDDIVVGTDIAGRNHAGIEGLVGFFVNQLVLRTAVRGGSSFRELLGRVREVALEGYAHQDVPFEKVVEALQPERDLTRHPLFQVKLVLQNAPVGELEMEGVRLRGVESGTLWAKYDVLLMLGEQGGEVRGRLEYNAELYESWRMERMAEHLRRVLEQAVREPDRRLREVAVLSDGERREVVEEWNRTEEVWGGAQTVTECLEESAAKWPESIAVAYGEEQLSYGELNRRANQLGRYLREWGVGPEVRVGLVVERSVEEAIAIWGVLKAGGAYVPLEASYPEERLGWLLEDSQVAVVVASRGAELPSFAGVVVSLDEIGGYGGDNLAVEVGARNLAYVIYTSGSTGRPKGVLVEHAGVVNYLRWAASAYAGGESTGSVVHSPLTFDLTVTSMFVPWMRGSEVRLVGRDPSLTQLREWSEAGRYSLLKITPAHLRVLGESVAGVEHLVVGGEALEGASLEPWRREAPETWVVNEYGPTETVVGCSVYTGRAKEYGAEAAPIGRGIANTQMYVLDGAMEAVPVGVRGEIYIGGAGVARGYLGRPELTAERFVPDGLSGEVGGRLYRTGDLGSWRRDGNLEFLGRADRQVKVRGYRVEPGEVEAVLRQQSGVREALVVAREGGLIAYVVGEGLESPVLRQAMRAALPDYMVPGVVIELAEIPRTRHGKLDQEALPKPGGAVSVADISSPRDSVELELVRICSELLHHNGLGVNDNFFEAGGNSFDAIALVSRIGQALNAQLTVASVFEAATPAGLAAVVRRQLAGKQRSPLVCIRAGGSRPPLYLVHPAAGTIMPYVGLAQRLAPGQPVYGFEAGGLCGIGQRQCHTVEGMADEYIQALLAVRAGGPFLLAGWSTGGLIAYEMARRLSLAGYDVPFLGLFDASPAQDRPASPENWHAIDSAQRAALLTGMLGDYISVSAEELIPLTEGEQLTRVLDEARRTMAIRPDFGVEDARALLRVFEACVRAHALYDPPEYAGPVSLFRCTENPDSTDPALGWASVVRGSLTTYPIPSSHKGMMSGPGLIELATQLSICLEQSELLAAS